MTKQNDGYHNSSHCKYLTQYHIIWCPKFRYPVLKNGIDTKLKEILHDICESYHYNIKALEVVKLWNRNIQIGAKERMSKWNREG